MFVTGKINWGENKGWKLNAGRRERGLEPGDGNASRQVSALIRLEEKCAPPPARQRVPPRARQANDG